MYACVHWADCQRERIEDDKECRIYKGWIMMTLLIKVKLECQRGVHSSEGSTAQIQKIGGSKRGGSKRGEVVASAKSNGNSLSTSNLGCS